MLAEKDRQRDRRRKEKIRTLRTGHENKDKGKQRHGKKIKRKHIETKIEREKRAIKLN